MFSGVDHGGHILTGARSFLGGAVLKMFPVHLYVLTDFLQTVCSMEQPATCEQAAGPAKTPEAVLAFSLQSESCLRPAGLAQGVEPPRLRPLPSGSASPDASEVRLRGNEASPS